MPYTENDRHILRDLASEYMEAAVRPVQEEKCRLWKALNRFDMQRPMVTIDQLPWNELNGGGELTLTVQDPFWRGVEENLRRLLYRFRNFPADMVLEPFIDIPAAVANTGYGLAPRAETRSHSEGDTAPSRHFENQIAGPEEIHKIKDIQFIYEEAESKRRLEEAKILFNGIGPVRLKYDTTFHLGVWDMLSQYMGVENIYYDLIDRPDFLHAAMRRITDATLAGIRQANELKIHDGNCNICHCSYIYTDELLPGFGQGQNNQSRSCWAFGLAQLFSSVSPEVTEEFEIPYISEMAKEFGMLYYGCCDRLDDRLELVKKIPNVKKVSCSPWSKRENFAEKIGPRLVMSNKPQPAYIAADSMEEEVIRRDLQETCALAKKYHVNLEIILKDISTVQFDPGRLSRWERIAMETVEAF